MSECIKEQMDKLIRLMVSNYIEIQLMAHVEANDLSVPFPFEETTRAGYRKVAEVLHAVADKCAEAGKEETRQ